MKAGIRRAAVIVPHQDDEILIGGAMLVELIRSHDWEVHVIYMTNGDSRGSWEAKIRMQDACNALGFLGLPQKYIHFLGYANRWQGNVHIYNASDENEILISRSGKDETYGAPVIPEFIYEREKAHHKYTRKNLKIDLKAILKEIFPDLCIVTDLDKHEDHRALSLLSEECIGELIKEERDYSPLVLKRFAYNGVWKGEKDYWEIPHKPTMMGDGVAHTYYAWDERIRFAVPRDCRTALLHKNTLFRASKLYRTQYVWTRAAGYLNADICFWQRHSDNLALHAEIKVSSGNAEKLNDFKLVDSADVRDSVQQDFSAGGWSPAAEDMQKEIVILFKESVTVRSIVIYECSPLNNGISRIKLALDDRFEKEISIEARKRNKIEIEGGGLTKIKKIKISIMESYGHIIGISEIEVFDQMKAPEEYGIPADQYIETDEKNSIGLKKLVMLEKNWMTFKEHWARDIWLPKWELCNVYPILLKQNFLYFPLQIYQICKKIFNKVMRSKGSQR